MVKPDDYSEETMKEVAARYEKEAKKINASRTENMTDSTVIYVLSESFSDPSRVPGLKVNKDSMPNIRSIKENTTSGLMLSSGYGGGTANLEYMGLTGLSMSNFDSSLTSRISSLCRASIGRRPSTSCGGRRRIPSDCTRTNRLCTRVRPTIRSSDSRISTR